MKIARILVPVDFSECSEEALRHAFFLAQRLGAEIDVLHAWTAPAYVSPYILVRTRQDAPEETLEDLARTQAARQMDAMLSRVAKPDDLELGLRIEFGLEDEVIRAASADYDLIVMGTHGRSGLSHLVLGSVAEEVVRSAACPVLTVRAPKTKR